MTDTPRQWHCIACNATDHFAATPDRVVHVGRGHIGRVVDADENAVQFEMVG